MSVQGWRAYAQALRFQPPEYQLMRLCFEFAAGSDAAERDRDWDVVKEAIPTLISRRTARALRTLALEWVDAARAAWSWVWCPRPESGPSIFILRAWVSQTRWSRS